MGRSLTAFMFTTLMVTDQTIKLTILNCSRLLSIFATTQAKTEKTSAHDGVMGWAKRCLPWLLNGTQAQRGSLGIVSTIKECAKSSTQEKADSSSARLVVKNLKHCDSQICSAPKDAKPLHAGSLALTTKPVNAPSVKSISQSTNTAQHSAAQGLVPESWLQVKSVSSEGFADVYCLSSSVGSFALANGAIVSNCDALGYAVWRLYNPLHARAGRGTGIRLY